MKNMLKFQFLIGLLLGGFFAVQAQNFNITDQMSKTEEGQDVDSWVAHLDQTIEYSKKTFEKFIKSNFDIKTDNRGKTILIVEKARFADISSLRGDMRAIYSSEGTGCMVGFIFSPGYDIHLTKQNFPEEFVKMQAFVKKYMKFHYTEYYKDFIGETEKQIKNKRDDIARNEKRIENNKKDIADNEVKINAGDKKADKLRERNVKMNNDIVKMQTEINTWQGEIVKLQETVNKSNEALKKVYEFQ